MLSSDLALVRRSDALLAVGGQASYLSADVVMDIDHSMMKMTGKDVKVKYLSHFSVTIIMFSSKQSFSCSILCWKKGWTSDISNHTGTYQ